MQFGGPEVLKVSNVEEPSLNADEVLVSMRAIGVNPVDTYIRTGTHIVKPTLPYTPGTDGAGIIEKIGNNVTQWKEGDRVYLTGSVTGTYAEKSICNQSHIQALPDNVTYEQGAAIFIPYGTAYSALFQCTRFIDK